MDYQHLLLHTADGVTTLTLNRPEKRNALNARLLEELIDALGDAAKSSAGVLLLTGAGDAFCAGMDLEHLKSLTSKTEAEHRADSAQIAKLMRTLHEFPKPTIAAVNGAAIAGGTGVATICDFTLAVPEAKFGYTEVRIGFVPAIVSSFLLLQVGEKRARDLLLTGRIFKAEEALAIGLVTRIVPGPELMREANALAQQLLANSPESLRQTKRLLTGFTAERLDGEMAASLAMNAEVRTHGDFLEGVSSFLEKRAPRWGR